MRVSLLAVIGLVLGAAIGGIIANVTIPSHEQMRKFAADLVPPGTVMTHVGQVTGFELFVGEYEAIASFDSRGAEASTVAEALSDHAADLGWTLVRIEPTAAGEQQFWSRENIRATIYVANFEIEEDGTIFVRYAASEVDRFSIGLALGAAVGLLFGVLLPRFVRHRSVQIAQ